MSPSRKIKESKREEDRTRRSRSARARKHRRYLLLALAATAAGGGAVAFAVSLYGFPAPIQARIDIWPDQHAVNGTLHQTEGEPVEAGQYWVLFNQLPTIESGSRACNIEFENPKENQYSARLNLYLESTGRRIGGTRRVDPGKYVETIELTETLEPGEYPVQARLELFTGREPAGTMTFVITLRVIKE